MGFINVCRRSGIYKYIQLAVNEDNPVAIALYEQVGFKVVNGGGRRTEVSSHGTLTGS